MNSGATGKQGIPLIPISHVADETVGREPVSGQYSLLTGNLQGIFTKIGPFGEKMPARTQQNQLVAGQFPAK
jgi:hypothetical protein